MTLSTPLAIRILSGVLGVTALVAVGWYTYAAFSSGLSLADLHLNWLIAAFTLHVLVVASLPVMWIRLLALVRTGADSEARLADPRLIHAYGRSWLARYVPGRVWMFGGRVLYGRSVGISARSTAASTVLESGLSYSALGLLGAALLVGAWVHWALAVTLALGAFSATFFAFKMALRRQTASTSRSRFVRLLQKSSGWLAGDTPPSNRALLGILAMFWVHAAAQLLFFIFVALSVERFGTGDYMLLAGAWGVGASIGYLSVFSAGGIGVRDGVALAFVGPAFTGPVAATVVAVSRIILVVADVALVGGIEIVNVFVRNRTASRGHGRPSTTTPFGKTDIATEKGS